MAPMAPKYKFRQFKIALLNRSKKFRTKILTNPLNKISLLPDASE